MFVTLIKSHTYVYVVKVSTVDLTLAVKCFPLTGLIYMNLHNVCLHVVLKKTLYDENFVCVLIRALTLLLMTWRVFKKLEVEHVVKCAR